MGQVTSSFMFVRIPEAIVAAPLLLLVLMPNVSLVTDPGLMGKVKKGQSKTGKNK